MVRGSPTRTRRSPPDAGRAYTANIGSGTVSVIDLAAGKKLRDLAVGGEPEAIALADGGRTLWVGDLQGHRVQAFDTTSFARLAEVETGAVPIRVAVSPDGKWVVTSNVMAGTLTVIDAKTRTKVRDVVVSGRPARTATGWRSPGSDASSPVKFASPDRRLTDSRNS